MVAPSPQPQRRRRCVIGQQLNHPNLKNLFSLSLLVPTEHVALVVQRKGKVERETATQITRSVASSGGTPGDDGEQAWSEIVVSGDPFNTYRAYQQIAQLVDEVDDVVAEFPIHPKRQHLIIGQGGATVKATSACTGVRINVPQQTKDGKARGGGNVQLEGEADAVFSALALILEAVFFIKAFPVPDAGGEGVLPTNASSPKVNPSANTTTTTANSSSNSSSSISKKPAKETRPENRTSTATAVMEQKGGETIATFPAPQMQNGCSVTMPLPGPLPSAEQGEKEIDVTGTSKMKLKMLLGLKKRFGMLKEVQKYTGCTVYWQAFERGRRGEGNAPQTLVATSEAPAETVQQIDRANFAVLTLRGPVNCLGLAVESIEKIMAAQPIKQVTTHLKLHSPHRRLLLINHGNSSKSQEEQAPKASSSSSSSTATASRDEAAAEKRSGGKRGSSGGRGRGKPGGRARGGAKQAQSST